MTIPRSSALPASVRWYVNIRGDVVGPLEAATVRASIEKGEVSFGASVRDEESDGWVPVEQSPFRDLLPAPPSTELSLFGHVGLWLIAAVVFFLLVKKCEGPPPKHSLIDESQVRG